MKNVILLVSLLLILLIQFSFFAHTEPSFDEKPEESSTLSSGEYKGYIIKIRDQSSQVTPGLAKTNNIDQQHIQSRSSAHSLEAIRTVLGKKAILRNQGTEKVSQTPPAATNSGFQIQQEARVQQAERILEPPTATEDDLVVLGEYNTAFRGVALDITDQEAQELLSLPEVEAVYPNHLLQHTLMDAVELVGASSQWLLDEQGNNCASSGDPCVRGEGVTIGIIDTGVDYTHPDLGGCFKVDFPFVPQDGAKVCSPGESPCHANPTLIASKGAINPPESNQPNTVDSCSDGSEGSYQQDESIEALNVTSLSGSFSAGETVKVEAEAHCFSTNHNDVTISYRTDISEWRIIDSFKCTETGLNKNYFITSFSLDDHQGYHVVRASIDYNQGATTCATSVFGDNDDVVIQLEEVEITECKVVGGYDFPNHETDPMDELGHGTHVASIAAGKGDYNNNNIYEPELGEFWGVAPDAQIYAFDVFVSASAYESDVIAAIERSMDPNQDGNTDDHLDVISMSLGGPGDPDDLLSQITDTAVETGIVVVSSAGNNGPQPNTINSPGMARKEITVGATMKQPFEFSGPSFSSDGPVEWNGPGGIQYLLKPDVVAPGVDICAAQFGDYQSSSQCHDDDHVSLSGTSMSTPQVSGLAALLISTNPQWSAEQIKAIITSTATPMKSREMTEQGSGLIDTLSALNFPGEPCIGTIDEPLEEWTDSIRPPESRISGSIACEDFDSYSLWITPVLDFILDHDAREWHMLVESSEIPEDGTLGYLDYYFGGLQLLQLRILNNEGGETRFTSIINSDTPPVATFVNDLDETVAIFKDTGDIVLAGQVYTQVTTFPSTAIFKVQSDVGTGMIDHQGNIHLSGDLINERLLFSGRHDFDVVIIGGHLSASFTHEGDLYFDGDILPMEE